MTQPTANCIVDEFCHGDANMISRYEAFICIAFDLPIDSAAEQNEAIQNLAQLGLDRSDSVMSSSNPTNVIEDERSELFEIIVVPGKGLGVVAVKDIAAGTCLLVEEPVMIIPNPQYTATYLQELFDDLSPSIQEAIMNLASAHDQDTRMWPCDLSAQASEGSAIPPPRIHPSVQGHERTRITDQHIARLSAEKSLMSIVMTNAISLNDGSGIFLRCSRFNHSCIPNATYIWQINLQKETVYVTRDIKAGEEILVSYVDVYDGPEMRAYTLKNYGFKCQCRACVDDGSGFAAESRDRRWRLNELFERQGNLTLSNKERICDLVEEIALLKEEGVFTVALNQRYLRLAELLANKGDARLAVAAAKHAVEFGTLCAGPEYEGTLDAQRELRRYEDWTVRMAAD